MLGSASQRQQNEDACFQEIVWWSQGVPVGAEGRDGQESPSQGPLIRVRCSPQGGTAG